MAIVRKGMKDRVDVSDDAIIYLYSRLPFLSVRNSQILNSAFATYAGSVKVTVPQYQLLELVARRGPSTQIDLARKAGGDAATIGLILRNVIASGLVARHADPADGRRKIVTITDAGRAVLDIATEADRKVCRRVAERLGEDASTLDTLLDALLEGGEPPPDGDAGQSARQIAAPAPSLIFKMRRFQQLNERVMVDAVSMLGLTAAQFTMLYVLLAIPGLNKSEAVRMTGFEGSNVALVIGLLLEKGLIETVDPMEKRRFQVTPGGAKLLAASHLLAMEAEASVTKDLDAADTVILQRLLGRIIREFDSDMRQSMPAFVRVQTQPRWPMPVAPAPSLMLKIRNALAA